MLIVGTQRVIMDGDPIVIDQMDPAESEAVSALFAEIVNELPYYNAAAKASEIEQYSAGGLRNLIVSDPSSVLVAKTDNIVGFCLSRYDDGLIWISWFGVHPKYRRRKIASALLNTLEHTVSDRGSHKVWCDSRTNNDPSIAILTKRHYQQICTVRNHWYGQDFILWEKVIG
jgi:ribosomal protein S18 acetylase RimI-like enzyme